MAGDFPAIAELLPHCGKAVWLDAVLEKSANHIRARACITREHTLFVAGHGVPAWAGIEFMAQAAAVHAGLENRDSGRPPRMGLLLGTRRYQMHAAYFPEGAQLEILAQREFGDSGSMGACRCTISSAGRILASATLIILETDEGLVP
jgi:predicted hotdog family 3-hydroxylacyl-ACP dehydratase